MIPLHASDFAAYFRHVNGDNPPFPWQEQLATRVATSTDAARAWPRVLALPTASGKTACIDIAVFALACQWDWGKVRTAPRRIFPVVDRRVIVDEMFERAQRLARRLKEADGGVLLAVAQRLRRLARCDAEGGDPLACFLLRGGIYRADTWARSPAQPTIVCSTVDQFGSRLLFRGYGRSHRAWPIHAGLAGNDSLIILDEAHCAVPFAQTLESVRKYRTWAERPLTTPFAAVLMTATPPSEFSDVFPSETERGAAFDSPELQKRLTVSKMTELVIAAKPKAKASTAKPTSGDPLVLDAAERAARLVADGRRRVAVMVNRVATAKAIHDELCADRCAGGFDGDVVLMTGRMRPLDREAIEKRCKPFVQANQPLNPPKPLVLVTTQCLEVGADFSFDALLSECAAVDAVRQRFGRLDRLGRVKDSRGVILIRPKQAQASEDDPLYGPALQKTWAWLTDKDGRSQIDMGIAAVDGTLPTDPEERQELLTPTDNAPVMLPAHVDCWAQTSPAPLPTPDVSLFLHGPEHNAPEVQVCWRADLDPTRPDNQAWVDAVALCPPTARECMSVPVALMRRWWRAGGKDGGADDLTDVEGTAAPPEVVDTQPPPEFAAVRWLGPDDSELVKQPGEIRPGDTIVLPEALGGWESFGHIPAGTSFPIDAGDLTHRRIRGQAILRVHPALLRKLPPAKAREWLEEQVNMGQAPEDSPAEVLDALCDLADLPECPEWVRDMVGDLKSDRVVITPHPTGGLVLRGSRRWRRIGEEEEGLGQEDDTASATVEVALDDHCRGVAEWAARLGAACGLPPEFVDDLMLAARLHDLGKADPRFQAWLHGGSALAARRSPRLLAKSGGLPQTRSARRTARERSGYPERGRHELLSVRMAESAAELLSRAHDLELVLHLIASHHGHCRPLAPVVEDPEAAREDLQASIDYDGHRLHAPLASGLEYLGSGVPERFWKLVRRYGWWGLAWIESIFRLADQRCSEQEQEQKEDSR